jgi:hypothetical protein
VSKAAVAAHFGKQSEDRSRLEVANGRRQSDVLERVIGVDVIGLAVATAAVIEGHIAVGLLIAAIALAGFAIAVLGLGRQS